MFLVNYINKHFQVSNETIYDRQKDIENMQDEYECEFFDEDFAPPTDDPLENMAFAQKVDINSLFQENDFYEIAQQISSTKKKLLFKESEDTIKTILNKICVDLEQMKNEMNTPQEFPYYTKNQNSNLIKYFQNDIYCSKKLTDKEKSVALQIIMEEEQSPSEKIQNAYIEKIKNKEISLGKAIQAINNPYYEEKLIQIINQEPEICENFNGKKIFDIIKNHPNLINEINDESKNIISRLVNTHSLTDAISSRNKSIESLSKYDTVDYLSTLYKNDIITKEQVVGIDTSRIRFVDIEYAKKNYGEDFIKSILMQKENKTNNKMRFK